MTYIFALFIKINLNLLLNNIFLIENPWSIWKVRKSAFKYQTALIIAEWAKTAS